MATATQSSRALAFAVVCLLAAGYVLANPVHDAPLSYAPVPVSTLVSSRYIPFGIAHFRQQQRETSVLAAHGPGGKPVPVASIVSESVGERTHVAVHRLPVTVAGRSPSLMRLLTFEQLYALTLRMDPGARFCLAQGRDACDPAVTGTSHAAFLRNLADARASAAAMMAGTLRVAAWNVISMEPSGQRDEHHDAVSVRVLRGQRAMPRVTVFFHRAPHSGCQATTDANGFARCELVDHHGHLGAHDGEEAVPVLVTYPGDVRAERILLPTTQALVRGQ